MCFAAAGLPIDWAMLLNQRYGARVAHMFRKQAEFCPQRAIPIELAQIWPTLVELGPRAIDFGSKGCKFRTALER